MYAHMGYGSTYQRDRFVEIEKGLNRYAIGVEAGKCTKHMF